MLQEVDMLQEGDLLLKTTLKTSGLDFFFLYFLWSAVAQIFMHAQTMYALLSFFTSIMNTLINFPSNMLFLVVCLCYNVSRSNVY